MIMNFNFLYHFVSSIWQLNFMYVQWLQNLLGTTNPDEGSINDTDASSGSKAHGADSTFNQRALFARVERTMSRSASEPPSTMACERCINAPGYNPLANERAWLFHERLSRWACDLMVPKHAYEILRFREFFHFRAGVATPPPCRSLPSVNIVITDCCW